MSEGFWAWDCGLEERECASPCDAKGSTKRGGEVNVRTSAHAYCSAAGTRALTFPCAFLHAHPHRSRTFKPRLRLPCKPSWARIPPSKGGAVGSCRIPSEGHGEWQQLPGTPAGAGASARRDAWRRRRQLARHRRTKGTFREKCTRN